MLWARHCETAELPVQSQLLIFIGHDLVIKTLEATADRSASASPLLQASSVAHDLPDQTWRFVAEYQGRPVYCSRSPEWQDWLEHNALSQASFRSLLSSIDADCFELIASASQLLTWEQDHQYCCRCGTRVHIHAHENAMCCHACGYRQYPRINPCVIVLITQGDQVLLARNANFKANYFSCIAGFIEPGERVEQALHREVKEEIGVEIKNLRYISSQSWPFPHSLMLGFICDYAGGDIQVDGHEIVEARWGRLEDFPERPGHYAISGQLMQHFQQELNASKID